MHGRRIRLPKPITLIEQLFMEIVKRKMTPGERSVLLPKPKKKRKAN
jgi:hypothetical protein